MSVVAFFLLLTLVIALGLAWQFGRRAGRQHDAELNRENWEIHRAVRRVHDQAVAAFDELLSEARQASQSEKQERP